MTRSVVVKSRYAALACCASMLAACASMTTIGSPNPGTTLELEDKRLELPATTKVGRATFGHFAFRATEPAKPEVFAELNRLEVKVEDFGIGPGNLRRWTPSK